MVNVLIYVRYVSTTTTSCFILGLGLLYYQKPQRHLRMFLNGRLYVIWGFHIKPIIRLKEPQDLRTFLQVRQMTLG